MFKVTWPSSRRDRKPTWVHQYLIELRLVEEWQELKRRVLPAVTELSVREVIAGYAVRVDEKVLLIEPVREGQAASAANAVGDA